MGNICRPGPNTNRILAIDQYPQLFSSNANGNGNTLFRKSQNFVSSCSSSAEASHDNETRDQQDSQQYAYYYDNTMVLNAMNQIDRDLQEISSDRGSHCSSLGSGALEWSFLASSLKAAEIQQQLQQNNNWRHSGNGGVVENDEASPVLEGRNSDEMEDSLGLKVTDATGNQSASSPRESTSQYENDATTTTAPDATISNQQSESTTRSPIILTNVESPPTNVSQITTTVT